MKLKKGYSLIEIVIGLAIMIIFLFATGSLINASYTNYRLVTQRNEAMDLAISKMEELLGESGDRIIEDFKARDSDISPSTVIYDVGFIKNAMEARVKIEKVKQDKVIYDDKVFIVTVEVFYARTSSEAKKYSIQLQTLKVMK